MILTTGKNDQIKKARLPLWAKVIILIGIEALIFIISWKLDGRFDIKKMSPTILALNLALAIFGGMIACLLKYFGEFFLFFGEAPTKSLRWRLFFNSIVVVFAAAIAIIAFMLIFYQEVFYGKPFGRFGL